MADKRLKIVIGYSVVDESKSNGEFIDVGIVYRDAPLPVLQAVHEVMAKYSAVLLEVLQPISRELTDMGYDAASVAGVPGEKLEFVKEKFKKRK